MRNTWVADAIAKRMKEAARMAEMSAPMIARKMGVSPATVYRWWEGERVPRPDVLERYAAAVGVEVAWINSGAFRGEVVRDVADMVLSISRMIEGNMPADEAWDKVTGSSDELSLRERRELRSNTEGLRKLFASLPADDESRRVLFEQYASFLRNGK